LQNENFKDLDEEYAIQLAAQDNEYEAELEHEWLKVTKKL
jgi:hypothetical protein